MSDDEFFNSPRPKEKNIVDNIETKRKSISNEANQITEFKDNGHRKDIKIIEAKIPSVTTLSDSVTSNQTDESDSDNDSVEYSPNSRKNNELEINCMPNKMYNHEIKNISKNEYSDEDDASQISEVKKIANSKTASARKSNSSSDIQNLSIHNKEQARELKQFLGSLINRNSRDGSINSNTIKNYSFSNDKLKAIDKENQRLLEKITLYASESKKSRQSLNQNNKMATRPISSGHSRPSSAAVNRRMQQRKIEDENMAMLRRLQQARPSKELQALNASRPSSSLSTRSNSMTSLRPGSAKKRSNAPKSEEEFTFKGDHLEPSTALQFT